MLPAFLRSSPIIAAVVDRLGIAREHVAINLDRLGNARSARIYNQEFCLS